MQCSQLHALAGHRQHALRQPIVYSLVLVQIVLQQCLQFLGLRNLRRAGASQRHAMRRAGAQQTFLGQLLHGLTYGAR